MRESIFSSSIRAFFIALFAMIGICVGLVVLVIAISSLSETATSDVESSYSHEIVANAEGKRKALSKDAPVVLKINIQGIIGTENLNMNTIRKQLIESREGDFKNDRVKALLVQINTPGGTVVDSDGIYRALKAYKELYKVPVFAYVDGLCASGGMYVASAADKIYASDISLIGSVGVISPSFLNFSQTLDKLGIQSLTLSAGKGKDDMNPLRPWRAGEQDSYQAIINYYYNHFVNVVTSNRPEISKEKLIEDYGAQIFNAEQSKEYGFINASGYSLNSTISELVKEIGIQDDFYQVVEMKTKSWISEFLKSEFSLLKGKVTHQLLLTPEMDANLMNQFLYLYRPER